MGGGTVKSNPTKARKRVEAAAAADHGGAGSEATTTTAAAAASMVRAKDGSAFTRCEECNKNVPVALISFHSCSLDAKIKMNLEAQVVEKPTEVKKPAAERKKATTSTEPKSKKAKKETAAKGSKDKPKRPPTAFFLFMDDFRKTFKEANPGSKDVKRVAKEGGEKWRSMTDEEKKPYVDKAAELKDEYTKASGSNTAGNEDDDEGGSKSEKEGAEQEVQQVSDDEE